LRILIVEDNRTSRFVLRRLLEKMGSFEIHEAEDGQQGWEMLSSGLLPDLCFFDYDMPRLNGLELLRRIRSEPRLAGLRVCFCSAVRDRQAIVQAATLKLEQYILKPYSRAAIYAQVQQALGGHNPAESLEPARDVCARLGIAPATYQARLDGLKGEVRGIASQLPTQLMQLDIAGVYRALDHAKRGAQEMGARRIYRIADGLSRSLQASGGLLDRQGASKEEMAANLQQWLGRSAADLMQAIGDLRAEIETLDRMASTAGSGGEGRDYRAREQGEIDLLGRLVKDTLQRGKLLLTSRTVRTKSLNIPIRASILGQDPAKTVGAVTRKTTFSLNILDPGLADAIEDCRKTSDLVRMLSFGLDAGARWIPDQAIGLLEGEIDARNSEGMRLLRQAIGGDLEAFLGRQEALVRENLGRLFRESTGAGEPSEAQVREILEEIRGRVEPALEGNLASCPVFSSLDLAGFEDQEDEKRWASPLALLHQAAVLQRNALADPAFDRTFKCSTFDRQTFLQTMNVFADSILCEPDAQRASRELEQIEGIVNSPVSTLDKCRLLWAIIKGNEGERLGKPGLAG
jgi:two-component system chemotaxis response regulator CheY